MFKKLMCKLLKLTSEQNAFDPSQLNDPVAMQTSWTPAKSGGANFQTHKLVKVNTYRLEFRASIGAKLFYLIFLLVGIGVLIGVSFVKLSSGGLSFNIDTIMPLAMGLIFTVIGGAMVYFGTRPIVFDKTKGAFWKARQSPAALSMKQDRKHFAELERIHALQLIAEYVRGNKTSYYSYELNLVLGNGDRVNVIDHSNESKLREDARTLSAFLEKPVWDAI